MLMAAKSVLAAVLLFLVAAVAYASTTTLSIIVNGPASTAITCTPAQTTAYTAPVAAGTVMATCFVSPSGWSGTLASSNAAFSMSGMNLVVGSTALVAGTYNVTVTSTP
jgi:hypothetical protein